ncbi:MULTISPECIES: tetratricopeptide repeat protein [Streptomyces]|uniref:tetratricopeptide repeat protein n=1 Tax=Streptomyces TaxID=1883 RepID=UPI0004BD4D6D|nr:MULTISPECIES: tetratricopeptide repeat protein [Streptomyces]
MVERLVLDLCANGRMSVARWPAGEPHPAPAVQTDPLRWPLVAEELEELRWYLEDYLRAPFGVYGERGPDIAERLRGWGIEVFAALLGSGPARDFYLRALSSGGALEIVVRSDSAQLLALPWELMTDPGRPSPLVLDGVAVTRSLLTERLGRVVEIGGSRLRVLMVIARPDGPADVGYRTIARPLLERLAPVRDRVELVVLRPPTLDRLGQVLRQAHDEGRPYHIVHFDGHGSLGEADAGGARTISAGPRSGRRSPLTFHGPGPRGLLTFERPGGGAELVSAERVARVLAAAQVPLVVLNACQSATLAAQVEATVATRLLQEGAGAVLAMAYTVYTVAAAEFMAAFYERLFTGDRVSEAVAVGRRQLAVRDGRPSPVGQLPLADWMVPVLYSSSEVVLPDMQAGRPAAGANPDPYARILDRAVDRVTRAAARATVSDAKTHPPAHEDADGTALVGEFIGRDGLLLRLDVAARLRHVVVLHGTAGVGKTELAKAFGRWCRDTGAVAGPEEVIMHSFEPGLASFGLPGVIDRIGRRLFDADRFGVLGPAERRAAVEDALAQRDLLLLWDNVESAYTMPDPEGAVPRLSEAERAELRSFLEGVAARGRSAIVLTSRTSEDWLGPVPLRIEVPCLEPEEAVEYADQLLAAYPGTARKREQRVFGDLMTWLDGHPLSMRLILPMLDTREPREMLHALTEGAAQLPAGGGFLGDGAGARGDSLAASIAYSLSQLPEPDRRALAVITLLHGTIDTVLLALLSVHKDVPARFEDRTGMDWRKLLERAAGVGLLTETAGSFRYHPSLPAYLLAQWRAEESDFTDQRAAALRAAVDVVAYYCETLKAELYEGDSGEAVSSLEKLRPTMGHLLGHALDHGLWEQAYDIVCPLDDYWSLCGLYAEARGWVDRVRLLLEEPDGTAPGLLTDAGKLWVVLVSAEGHRELRQGLCDQAERTFQDIHRAVEALPPGRDRADHRATSYHQFGRVAMERGQWTEARTWYLRALELLEWLKLEKRITLVRADLSIVANPLGRREEAELLLGQTRSAFEQLGDSQRIATTEQQLGVLAREHGHFAQAYEHYLRGMAIAMEMNDRSAIGTLYQQLAIVALETRKFAAAETWSMKALAIFEELGSRPQTAHSYQHLGTLARMRGRLPEADAWLNKSLEICQTTNDDHCASAVYQQLGAVASQRGDQDRAEKWYAQAVDTLMAIGDRPGLWSIYHLRCIAAFRGGRSDAAEWWCRKALELAHEVGNPLAKSRSLLQLGLLAEMQRRDEEALTHVVASITTFEEFPHPATAHAAFILRLQTRSLGVPALERAWRSVTGRRLPRAVRKYAKS